MIKTLVLLLLAIDLVFCANYGYCYSDENLFYSINFPKGWTVKKATAFGVNGVQATSPKQGLIIVGAKKQYTDHIVFSNEFARYLTINTTYTILKAICNDVSIIDARSVVFKNKFKALVSKLKCDDEIVITLHTFKNNITYQLTAVANPTDRNLLQTITRSMDSFKITQ